MANLEKRGAYSPRRVREQRAYRLVVAGGITGVAGVAGLVLAIAGVVSAFWPIVLLILCGLCVVGFRNATR